MKVLLDTNVCIAVMRGHLKAVRRLSQYAPKDCTLSTVVLYELFTGVAKCQEPERERGKVHRFLSAMQVVNFDEAAAKQAAQVRVALERTGLAIGPYDLLLAGHALALGLSLATNNIGEFSRVDGLRIEDWLS